MQLSLPSVTLVLIAERRERIQIPKALLGKPFMNFLLHGISVDGIWATS
jgi:hypothetical protein